jgi:hypothetical protein
MWEALARLLDRRRGRRQFRAYHGNDLALAVA